MMSLAAGANCSTFPEHELDQNHAGCVPPYLLSELIVQFPN